MSADAGGRRVVILDNIDALHSLRVTYASRADASRVGPIIRVDGDHLLRTAPRVRHWGCGSSAGSISRVGERVASGRGRAAWAIIRIIVIVSVRNVGVDTRVSHVCFCCCCCVGCVWWIVDAIVDGTEDRAGDSRRLGAVVNCAVWVG